MIKLSSHGRNPVLSLANVVLCAAVLLIVREILSPWTVSITPQASVPNGTGAHMDSAEPHQQLAVISEHPLFIPSRRPWMPVARSTAPSASSRPVAPPAEPTGYSLKGISISPRGRSALIWSQASHTTTRLVPTQMLEGWTLVTIKVDGLEFMKADQIYRLAFPSLSGARPTTGQRRPDIRLPSWQAGHQPR